MDIRKIIEDVIESHLIGDYPDGALQRISLELKEEIERNSKEEVLDYLGRVTRLANRLKNKHPEMFSENDKKIVSNAMDVMSKNSKLTDIDFICRS